MDSKTPSSPLKSHPLIDVCDRDHTVMVDLHGLSVQQAKESIIRHVAHASGWGWNRIRFVTGRGNHINAQGERGTLYKNFRNYLHALHDKITSIAQYDGYYEVIIKHEALAPNPFLALMNDLAKRSMQDKIEDIKKNATKGDVNSRITLALCYDKAIGVKHSYHNATNIYPSHFKMRTSANAVFENYL